ncbi:hypothetical protein ScalyP_jg41, partial [Parmales sp. scaly parma]
GGGHCPEIDVTLNCAGADVKGGGIYTFSLSGNDGGNDGGSSGSSSSSSALTTTRLLTTPIGGSPSGSGLALTYEACEFYEDSSFLGFRALCLRASFASGSRLGPLLRRPSDAASSDPVTAGGRRELVRRVCHGPIIDAMFLRYLSGEGIVPSDDCGSPEAQGGGGGG